MLEGKVYIGQATGGKLAYRVWPLSLNLTAKKEGGGEIFPGAQFRLKQGDRNARFPEGTFPPGLPYVPTVADLLAGG